MSLIGVFNNTFNSLPNSLHRSSNKFLTFWLATVEERLSAIISFKGTNFTNGGCFLLGSTIHLTPFGFSFETSSENFGFLANSSTLCITPTVNGFLQTGQIVPSCFVWFGV